MPEKQWMLHDSHRAHSQSIVHQTNLNRTSGTSFGAQVLIAAAAADADAAAEEVWFESLQHVSIQKQPHLAKS
jgi:hypothetical protein